MSEPGSRRGFLRALSSVALAVSAMPFVRVRRSTFFSQSRPMPTGPFTELMQSASTVAVGEFCLQLPGCEHRAVELAQLVGIGDDRTSTLRLIQSDFERGDTVRVNGWVLSRTEARLYALAALNARS
ncbi:MAG TPA: hypothetical protein VGD49_08840 [Longimicrobiales bacterium]